MSLNIRSTCASLLFIFIFSIFITAQTSADVMRERVAKAKAYIAVKNFNAAIYELENIRRETKDPTVNNVINVLLMNSYLEQGDYKRAQDFLKEISNPQNKLNNQASYYAVAGQVVKGARNQMERYRALGLSISDRSLPIEAAVDIDKMRETLELVVEQSKVLGKDKTQASDAMALIEEATNARSSLAKDDYDASRWKNEAADARESLASSRSVITNAVNTNPVDTTATNSGSAPANSNAINQNSPADINSQPNAVALKPVQTSSADNPKTQTAQNNVAKTETQPVKIEKQTIAENNVKQSQKSSETTNNSSTQNTPNTKLSARERRIENEKDAQDQKPSETAAPPVEKPKNDSPLAVGSLVEFATEKTSPTYPSSAKSMRMTGIVRVELMVNEEGNVVEIQKTSGPSLLQRAATDAVKKWKFKPFVRDGEPVKAIGFVSFNFNL